MVQNLESSHSHSDPKFLNEDEIEVVEIIAQLPMLIYKSNLTRFVPVWKTKRKRSAINRSPPPPPPSDVTAPPCNNNSGELMKVEDQLPNPAPIHGVSVIHGVPSETSLVVKDKDKDDTDPSSSKAVLANPESKSKTEKVPVMNCRKAPTRKERTIELRKKVDELHNNERILHQQIKQVEAYVQKLVDYQLKLIARREELVKSNGKVHLLCSEADHNLRV